MPKRPAPAGELEASEPSAKRRELSYSSEHADNGSGFDHESPDSSTCPSTAPTPSSTRSRPKNISCPVDHCGKRFNRPSRLEAHLRSHRGERPFACTWEGCDKSYIEDKHLQQHVRGAHEKVRDHKCDHPGCDKSFLTGTRLRRHQDTHTGTSDKYRCNDFPPCAERFRQKSTLERHVREAHLKEKPFACKEAGCSESFNSSGALRNHKQREHGDIKHWCDVCKELNGSIVGFVMLSELLDHTRTEHRNCEFCNIKCQTNYELVKHIEMYHSGQTVSDRKTVACPYEGCPKVFTRQSNLNSHVGSCHEGRRFVCGVDNIGEADGLENWNNANGCRKDFSSKANLESHIRHLHLKQPRSRRARGQKKEVDVLDDLAGATETVKRDIPCTEPGCNQMFKRHHDRRLHCASAHAGAVFDNLTEVEQATLNIDQEELVPNWTHGTATEPGPGPEPEPVAENYANYGGDDSLDVGQLLSLANASYPEQEQTAMDSFQAEPNPREEGYGSSNFDLFNNEVDIPIDPMIQAL